MRFFLSIWHTDSSLHEAEPNQLKKFRIILKTKSSQRNVTLRLILSILPLSVATEIFTPLLHRAKTGRDLMSVFGLGEDNGGRRRFVWLVGDWLSQEENPSSPTPLLIYVFIAALCVTLYESKWYVKPQYPLVKFLPAK